MKETKKMTKIKLITLMLAATFSASSFADQCQPVISVIAGKVNVPYGFYNTGHFSKKLTAFLPFNSATYNYHNHIESQDGKVSCIYTDNKATVEIISISAVAKPKPSRMTNKWEPIFHPDGYACNWGDNISPSECQW